MKSWSRKTAFNKNKTVEYLWTGLLAVILLASVLYPITDLDQITTLGNEIQYWGGAMSILGQDWSYYMDSQAMISYGYSLILLPICMIFQNATFAYKAAIMLNGCFVILSYLLTVKVAKNILREHKSYVAIVGSFLITLLPIYGDSRTEIGPMPLMILLFWISVNLIVVLQDKDDKRIWILLGISVTLLTWLDITMLAVFAGTTIYLYFLTKDKGLSEETFLRWILFVLIGFCIGYVAEQICLYRIFDSADISYSSGLQVLIDKIISNVTEGGIIGFLCAILGKIYAVTINSFGMLIPALYYIVKQIRKEKKVDKSFCMYVTMNLSALLILIALCRMGTSEASCREILMTETMAVVIGPILLIAIKQLLDSKEWMEECIGHVAVLIGLTVIISYLFRNVTNIAVDNTFGVLHYAYNLAGTSQGMVYCGTVLTVMLFLLFCAAMKVRTKWVRWNGFCAAAGAILCVVISFYFVKQNVTYVVERQSEYTKYQQVADVLNAANGEIYFKDADASLKAHVPVLQMLANKSDIILADDDQEDIKGTTYITSSPYYNWDEEMKGLEPVCQVQGVVIWAENNSDSEEKINTFLTQKEYRATKVKSGKKSIYGKGITLSPGTYVAKYYIKVKKIEEGTGKLRLKVKSGTDILQSKTLYAEDIEKGKSIVVELKFNSAQFMEDCKFYIQRDSNAKINIEKIVYQKVDGEYTFGLNCEEEMKEVTDITDLLNQKVGTEGSVSYYEEGMDIDETDYIICSSKLSICYELLDQYTILHRNEAYTLLGHTGNEYCKKMQEQQGFEGSDKNVVNLKTFLAADKAGDYCLEDTFSLESGDYRIILTLKLLGNKNNKKVLGVYRLKDGEERLAGKKIKANFFEENVCEISLPLIAYKGYENLHWTLNLEDGVEIEVLDAKVKMNGKKYDIGSEKNLTSFSKIINETDEDARVGYFTNRESKMTERYSTDYLQSILPSAKLEISLYDELMSEQGDLFVITRGYSDKFFKLVSKYTMIAQEGKYLLWVRSDGSLIIDAMKHGAVMLSQGTKISTEVLAIVQGKKYDGTVSGLSSGTYRFYIMVEVEDAVEGDTIEVGMSRDKTKAEISEEKETLEANGYTSKEIEEAIDKTEYADTQRYEMVDFKSGRNIITYQMRCVSSYKNLLPIVYSWKGSTVKGIVLWIENV